MRGIAALIVTLVIAGIVGVGAYQLGLAQGLASTGTAVAPVYHYPYFFGGFGFLFPLLFIILIFFILRGAFWGWGRGYGGPGAYWADRRARFEELHRELHGEKPRDAGGPPSTPPSGR